MTDRPAPRLQQLQAVDDRRACGAADLAVMFGIGGRTSPSVSAVAPARGEGALPTPSGDEAHHVH